MRKVGYDLVIIDGGPAGLTFGDIRNTPLRPIAIAVGDAAIVAYSARHYIQNVKP